MQIRNIVRSAFRWAFAAAALAGAASGAPAQQRLNTAHEPASFATALAAADLERAFWVCDHAATTRSVAAADAALCHAVYDRLKAEKFDGDFERLLAWWRDNKFAEHRKLDALQAESP